MQIDPWSEWWYPVGDVENHFCLTLTLMIPPQKKKKKLMVWFRGKVDIEVYSYPLPVLDFKRCKVKVTELCFGLWLFFIVRKKIDWNLFCKSINNIQVC